MGKIIHLGWNFQHSGLNYIMQVGSLFCLAPRDALYVRQCVVGQVTAHTHQLMIADFSADFSQNHAVGMIL